MQLSNKTEAAPILVSEGTSNNGTLQLLAEQYRRRLVRIRKKLADPTRSTKKTRGERLADPGPYYNQAEAAVRALYADAT